MVNVEQFRRTLSKDMPGKTKLSERNSFAEPSSRQSRSSKRKSHVFSPLASPLSGHESLLKETVHLESLSPTESSALSRRESSVDQQQQFYRDIPAHRFTVDGEQFEWIEGMYYKKINEIREEGSFGADALMSNAPRNATIKAMDEPVHFATLSRA